MDRAGRRRKRRFIKDLRFLPSRHKPGGRILAATRRATVLMTCVAGCVAVCAGAPARHCPLSRTIRASGGTCTRSTVGRHSGHAFETSTYFFMDAEETMNETGSTHACESKTRDVFPKHAAKNERQRARERFGARCFCCLAPSCAIVWDVFAGRTLIALTKDFSKASRTSLQSTVVAETDVAFKQNPGTAERFTGQHPRARRWKTWCDPQYRSGCVQSGSPLDKAL